MGIEAVNPFELPLLNTVILLSSGVTVTYAHHSLIQGNRSAALYGLVCTVILAIVFTALQGIEYSISSLLSQMEHTVLVLLWYWIKYQKFSINGMNCKKNLNIS
jgi:heme/copper-type cytochrome/quinol oxidase subunit 3